MRDYIQRVRCVEGGWDRWKISVDRARAVAKREVEREAMEQLEELMAENQDVLIRLKNS